MSLEKKIYYHLFAINAYSSKLDETVKLCRKSQWHEAYWAFGGELVHHWFFFLFAHCNYCFFSNSILGISGLDFNPNGEIMATMGQSGTCLISDVNTNKSGFYEVLKMKYRDGKRHLHCFFKPLFVFAIMMKLDAWSRCRWSTNTEEPFLFIKYDRNQLNVLDTEKKCLTLKDSVSLEEGGNSMRLNCSL